ncbi:hypothetical protein C8J56DRAFT_1058085 [Mycena floridula]|nr:hypothetical protein C8J56DRAFT_1058085 [Mycena floridula]
MSDLPSAKYVLVAFQGIHVGWAKKETGCHTTMPWVDPKDPMPFPMAVECSTALVVRQIHTLLQPIADAFRLKPNYSALVDGIAGDKGFLIGIYVTRSLAAEILQKTKGPRLVKVNRSFSDAILCLWASELHVATSLVHQGSDLNLEPELEPMVMASSPLLSASQEIHLQDVWQLDEEVIPPERAIYVSVTPSALTSTPEERQPLPPRRVNARIPLVNVDPEPSQGSYIVEVGALLSHYMDAHNWTDDLRQVVAFTLDTSEDLKDF